MEPSLLSMQRTPLAEAAALVRGAVFVSQTPDGFLPLRLPDWAWRQVPDPLTAEIFRMTAGIRISAITEARKIELDVTVTRLRVTDWDFPAYPVAFDLVVDGELHQSFEMTEASDRTFGGDGHMVGETPRRSVTVDFSGLPEGQKTVELCLPANAVAEICALRSDAPLLPSRIDAPRWIHHGSSISHCLEAPQPTGTWPAVAARLARVDGVNLGSAGNCHLDPFVARTIRDTPAECISLKVGINIVGGDTLKSRTFGPAVDGFLDTIREGHPATPLLVISPIICPALEDSPGPMRLDGSVATGTDDPNPLTLRRTREILCDIVERRRSLGDANIHYLDGLDLFGEDDLSELPDNLHPSPDGYRLIGHRFAEAVFSADGPFAAATTLLQPS
jgi:hypothetical protein